MTTIYNDAGKWFFEPLGIWVDWDDEWQNDELALELNHGNCLLEGRHPDTNDADWELFIRSFEEDYTEELWREMRERLDARGKEQFATDVLEYQVQLIKDLKDGKINHEEGMRLLKEKYPTVVSDDEDEDEDDCVDDDDRSYGPRGRPTKKDEDEDDNMSECDCCGELFELGTFNIAEDAECNQEAYCDKCWKLKIEDGCVWQEEDGSWAC